MPITISPGPGPDLSCGTGFNRSCSSPLTFVFHFDSVHWWSRAGIYVQKDPKKKHISKEDIKDVQTSLLS